jgi:hypothetical protein
VVVFVGFGYGGVGFCVCLGILWFVIM